MHIVLDTNVLVSALWSANSKPAAILHAVLGRRFTLCYDYRILEEYEKVLRRPKFHFASWQIDWLLDGVTKSGISVVPDPLPDIPFTDESDRMFLEVAKFCYAPLITGNTKHYPEDPLIVTVTDFFDTFLQNPTNG